MANSVDWTEPRTVPVLGKDEVHVWLASLDAKPDEVSRYYQVLSEDERDRADRYRFEWVRTHFIKGRWLLRQLLSHYVAISASDLKFRTGTYGKPELNQRIAGQDISLNLSHSKGMALFAFSRGLELGVDIEWICPESVTDELIRHVFSPTEQKVLFSLSSSSRIQGFFNGWTRKEAYLKGRGDGLYFPLKSFTVRLHPAESAELIWVEDDPEEVTRWSLRELPAPLGYAAALAVKGKNWSITHLQFSPDKINLEGMDNE